MALTATDLFNDATTREIGGVGPDQVNLIVSDLIGVQQMLSAADPQINNLTDLHTHVIINQLNEEIASIENVNSPTGTPILGTDLGQFVGQAAVTIENNGFTGDVAGLIQQIQTFENNANAFDQSQGGLWSARFWNEFRSDGTTGTAANALIEGLQTHNAGEVNAAAEQLAANSADVGRSEEHT